MKKTRAPQPPRLFARSFIRGEELDFFLENLSALLAAGIPIIEAIDSVSAEIRGGSLKRIIARIADDIVQGESLSTALRNSGLFSRHVGSLIEIGERSGRLVENLKVIATEQKKERALRSKIRSAALYPMFVLGLTLFIGIGIAWFILPKLAAVFAQLKIALPAVTKVLIAFGSFLGEYGLYVIPAFLVSLVVLGYLVFSYSKTRVVGEYILFAIPGVKKLVKEAEIARFGYLLGTLIAAGLPPPDALDSLADATTFSRYRDFYRYLSEGVVEGKSFKKSFASYPHTRALMPVPVQQLIVAGEQSGTLSRTLVTIGEDYEEKTEASTKDISVILEPILLVLVWLGVVAVALAVILPIYSLVGGFETAP